MSRDNVEGVVEFEIGFTQEQAEGDTMEEEGQPEGDMIEVPEALVLPAGTESHYGVSTDSLHLHQETLAFEEQLITEVSSHN